MSFNKEVVIDTENEIAYIETRKKSLLNFINENSIENILEDAQFWLKVRKYLKHIYFYIVNCPTISNKIIISRWLDVLKTIGEKHPDIYKRVIDNPINLLVSFLMKKTVQTPPWFYGILIKTCCECIEKANLQACKDLFLNELLTFFFKCNLYHLKYVILNSIINHFDNEYTYRYIRKEFRSQTELIRLFVRIIDNYNDENIRIYLNKFNQSSDSQNIFSFKYHQLRAQDVVLCEDNWIDFNTTGDCISFECSKSTSVELPYEDIQEEDIETISINFSNIIYVSLKSKINDGNIEGYELILELDSPCNTVYDSTGNFLKDFDKIIVFVTQDTYKFKKFIVEFFKKIFKNNEEDEVSGHETDSQHFVNLNLASSIVNSLRNDNIEYSYFDLSSQSYSDSQVNTTDSNSDLNQTKNSNSSIESEESVNKSLCTNETEIRHLTLSFDSDDLNEKELPSSIAETVIPFDGNSAPEVLVDEYGHKDNLELGLEVSEKKKTNNKAKSSGNKKRRKPRRKTTKFSLDKNTKEKKKPEFIKDSYYNFEDQQYFTDGERYTSTSTRTVRPPKRLIDELGLIKDGYATDSCLNANRKRKLKQVENNECIEQTKRIKTILPVRRPSATEPAEEVDETLNKIDHNLKSTSNSSNLQLNSNEGNEKGSITNKHKVKSKSSKSSSKKDNQNVAKDHNLKSTSTASNLMFNSEENCSPNDLSDDNQHVPSVFSNLRDNNDDICNLDDFNDKNGLDGAQRRLAVQRFFTSSSESNSTYKSEEQNHNEQSQTLENTVNTQETNKSESNKSKNTKRISTKKNKNVSSTSNFTSSNNEQTTSTNDNSQKESIENIFNGWHKIIDEFKEAFNKLNSNEQNTVLDFIKSLLTSFQKVFGKNE